MAPLASTLSIPCQGERSTQVPLLGVAPQTVFSLGGLLEPRIAVSLHGLFRVPWKRGVFLRL